MARSTLPEADPHVAWLAAWRELRDRYNRPGAAEADDPELGDQILELEDLIATTPATTRAAVVAQIELALAIMKRGFEDDRLEAQILRNAMAALKAGI